MYLIMYEIYLIDLKMLKFQDILQCRDSMELLNELNEKGRVKINQLRDEIESLEVYGKDTGDRKYIVEVESQRHQLAR